MMQCDLGHKCKLTDNVDLSNVLTQRTNRDAMGVRAMHILDHNISSIRLKRNTVVIIKDDAVLNHDGVRSVKIPTIY
jgi:hypothetical protein